MQGLRRRGDEPLMEFDEQSVREAISEFLSDDGLVFSKDDYCQIHFDLDTVVDCVNENSEFDINERPLAYAKGFVIFADVLKQYAQHYVDELERQLEDSS